MKQYNKPEIAFETLDLTDTITTSAKFGTENSFDTQIEYGDLYNYLNK